MNKDLLTIQEAAKILGVSTKTLRRWDKAGTLIPTRTQGNQRRYTKEQIVAFKKQRELPYGYPSALSQHLEGVASQRLPGDTKSLTSEVVLRPRHTSEVVSYIIVGSLCLLALLLGVSIASKSNLANTGVAKFLSYFGFTPQSEVAQIPPSRSPLGHLEGVGLAVGQVLAESTIDNTLLFNVNIPSKFALTSEFLKGISAVEIATLSGGIITENEDIDAGTGTLTASNVLYGATAGTGIILGTGQTPTITNSDLGSSQKIFKTIKVGSDSFSTGSNTDTLELAAGSNITLGSDTSNKKVTITGVSPTSAGWTDDGTTVRLTTSTDNVGIGTTSPDTKLHIAGTFKVTGTTTLNSVTYTWPSADGSSDYILSTNGSGTLSWTSAGGTVNFWQRNSGALSPFNITDDLLLGATATTSARFAVLNMIGSGTPTATVSANSGNNAVFLTGLGNLATTNMQTLTLGGSTTGNISIDSGSSAITVLDQTTFGSGTTSTLVIPNISALTGANNSIAGSGAGAALTSGARNTLFGVSAGNAIVSGNDNTFFGGVAGVLTTGSSNTAVGSGALDANTTGENNVAIGFDALGANTTSSNSVAVGYQAAILTTGTGNVVIGPRALSVGTTSDYNIVLGVLAGGNITTGDNNIILGRGADPSGATASNEFVAGSALAAITNVYFGEGPLDATPLAYTINGGGGSGTNIAGAALQLAGGRATGNAAGGSIVFQTSDAGASGTTLQSLTTKMTLTAAGNLGIGDTSPDYLLELSAAVGSDSTFSLSDGDVAHGLTTVAETDVWARILPVSSTVGGAAIGGITDASGVALQMVGTIGSTDPVDTTPAVWIVGRKSNGTTGVADLAAAETVFAVANNDDAINFVILGNGNVGIGDTNPDTGLELIGSGASNGGIILTQTNAGDFDPAIGFSLTDDSSTLFQLGVDDSDNDRFKIGTSALETNSMFALDSRTTTSGVTAIVIGGIAPTIASEATAEYTTFSVTPPTITLTGTTGVSGAVMESIISNRPTITCSSCVGGVTVTEADTLRIAGAPIAAGAAGSAVTITNAVGLAIPAASVVSGSGVVTNAYGLYVSAPTGATNNYAAVFNTGNVGIGTTAPTQLLSLSEVHLFSTTTGGSVVFNETGADIDFRVESDTNPAAILLDSGLFAGVG